MEKSTKNKETLDAAIQKVCHSYRIHDKNHVQAAVEIGRNLFKIIAETEVIPIVGDGITKFWTLPDFIKSFKKKLPAVIKSKENAQMNQLNQYAKSGNIRAYRELRKQMR